MVLGLVILARSQAHNEAVLDTGPESGPG